MKKIQIKNKAKTLKKQEYNKYKNDINKHCVEFYNLLDSTPKIKVIIKDDLNSAGSVYRKNSNTYILLLNKKTVLSHNIVLECVLFHEYAHIYDMEHAHKQIQSDVQVSNYCNDLEQYICTIGFDSWTEFFAYSKSMKAFNTKTNTFLELVKVYKNLIKTFKKIENEKQLVEFKNQLDLFVYSSSMYLANYQATGKRRKYCEKTKNSKEFKQLHSIYGKFYNKLGVIFHGVYGKRYKKRIFNLGDFIIRAFYVPFDIYPKKTKNGYILSYQPS